MGELGWKARSGTAVRVRQPDEFPVRLRAVRWLGRQTWIPKGQDRLVRMLWNPDLGRHFTF